MGWSPCSNCRQTRPGSLVFVYLTVFKEKVKHSLRVRLCEECMDTLLADVVAVAEARGSMGEWLFPEQR